jgi:hypothetical protein
VLGSLNRGPLATDSPGEQGPEAELRKGRPARGALIAVTARGQGCGDEPWRLPARRKPLKGKAWTCQRDETSPQGVVGSKPPRGCENLRADGGGGVEPIATADPGTDGAMRQGTS